VPTYPNNSGAGIVSVVTTQFSETWGQLNKHNQISFGTPDTLKHGFSKINIIS
jgi:hypothetical protein